MPKTDDQRERAAFFRFDPWVWDLVRVSGNKPLVETRRVEWILIGHGWHFYPGDQRTPAQVLEDLVCRSPVVLVGEAPSSQTFLALEEYTLFTDFPVVVDRWIRPGSGDRQILVSMHGGRAIVAGLPRLETTINYFMETRQRYLMFLKWSAPGRAYLHVAMPRPIAGGRVILEPPGTRYLEEETSYLKRLSDAGARCPDS